MIRITTMGQAWLEVLGGIVENTDVEGLRLLAWQELQRDGVLTGGKCDVELMMLEMKQIMKMRFEDEVKRRAADLILRQVRRKVGENLMAWVMRKHAERHISETASELEHVDLGVAG